MRLWLPACMPLILMLLPLLLLRLLPAGAADAPLLAGADALLAARGRLPGAAEGGAALLQVGLR
jgi:hypothetical protein